MLRRDFFFFKVFMQYMNLKLYMEIMWWKWKRNFDPIVSKLLTMTFLRVLNSHSRNPSGIGKEISMVFGRVKYITPGHIYSIFFSLFFWCSWCSPANVSDIWSPLLPYGQLKVHTRTNSGIKLYQPPRPRTNFAIKSLIRIRNHG